MATEWFCRIMGDEWGPMSARELLAVARRGRLTRDDVVRRTATGTWVRAEVVKGLFDSSVQGPTATSQRVAIAVRQAMPAQRSVRQVRATQYWIHNGKVITGPFSSRKIRQLAAEGRLDRNYLVRSDRSRWVRAWRIEDLVFGVAPPQPSTVLHCVTERPMRPPPAVSDAAAADKGYREVGGPLPLSV
jgi:GYF domain 2